MHLIKRFFSYWVGHIKIDTALNPSQKPNFLNFYGTEGVHRVWSCKVSKGVIQEQEFLVLHPCKMQDSCEKWSLKSREKYHCETLFPPNLTGPRGGATTLKIGGRASRLLGSRHFLQDQNPFSLCTDSTYLCIYGLAFLARPGLQDETQVSREKSCTCLTRSHSKTKLY
jgi:hypothetical protein